MFTGEKLRLLRQARQIKQKEMARRMGICQQRYSVLERSEKINEEHVDKILFALSFSRDQAIYFINLLPGP